MNAWFKLIAVATAFAALGAAVGCRPVDQLERARGAGPRQAPPRSTEPVAAVRTQGVDARSAAVASPSRPSSGERVAGVTSYGESRGEQVSMGRLLEWWPFRPLLRNSATTARESFFAASETGGTRGDPRKELAGAMVLYTSGGSDPDAADFWQLLAAGAWEVKMYHFPAGEAVTFSHDAFRKMSRTVVVRNRPARLLAVREGPQSNVTWRSVRWEEAAPGGGVVQFIISNHPDRYTDDETLQFIESLVEIP